jgi:hypothetical protein
MEYSDVKLTKMGKAVSPAAQRREDPATIQDMAAKYGLFRAEWRRRHPKKQSETDFWSQLKKSSGNLQWPTRYRRNFRLLWNRVVVFPADN